MRLSSLALAMVLAAGAAGAEPAGPSPMPEQGVLLLRNGQSLEGKISQAGELYYVAVPDGEIRIKAADVDLWCRDLEEGYRQKRARIQPGNVLDHLRLAQWCLRQGLMGHAAGELSDALDADPRHPATAVLQRRLQMATEPPPPVAGVKAGRRAASPDDLERMVRGLPARSVETFTQTVQPLLVNHCSAAGCHGPGSPAAYHLLRLPVGGPPSKLLTQRNLHATLQWVDRKQPAASRLLTAPVQPHGTAKAAVFGDHHKAQYQRLADWVNQLAQPPQPEAPATVNMQDNPPVHASRAGAARKVAAGKKDLRKPEVVPATHEETAAEGDAGPSAAPPSKVKRGAQVPQFTPADPFDAETFNRRYHGEK